MMGAPKKCSARASTPKAAVHRSPRNLAASISPIATSPPLQFIISFGRGCQDARPVPTRLTWDELVDRFRTPQTDRGELPLAEYLALDKKVPAQKQVLDREKNGEYFIPAEFAKPNSRTASDVATLTGFVIDLDAGNVSRAEIEAKLNGFKFLAYTSYSHHPGDHRWRIFIPYAKAIPRERHAAMYSFFVRTFEYSFDKRSATANQLWYTPACPHDALQHFEFFVGAGEFFDTSLVPAIVPVPVTAPTKVMTPSTKQSHAPARNFSPAELSRVKSALDSISADDRQVWIKVGLALHRDVGPDDGRQLWLEWSVRSTKFDPVDADSTWESFSSQSDSDKQVTLGTVFYLAKENGWVDVPDWLTEVNQTQFMAFESGKSWVFREEVDPELDRRVLNRYKLAAVKEFQANDTVLVQQGDSTKRVNRATAWQQHPGRRSYTAISFVPGKPAPQGHYNLWQGFAFESRAGTWSLMNAHIAKVICNGDVVSTDYLLNWLAYAVQHPDKRGEVAVVLKGERGTGKGIFVSMFGKLFGPHFLQVTQSRHLVGNFNKHLRSCVVLFVDEALWAGDKQGESVLKALITEDNIQIESKGVDTVTAPNRLHIMMASNNEWVVPAGAQERRYFVLEVGVQRQQDQTYFSAINKQMVERGGLEAMMYDLANRDITKFNIRSVPRTTALDAQIIQSLDPGHRWWMEHLGQVFTPPAWKHQERDKLLEQYILGQGRTNSRSSATSLGMLLKKLVRGGPKKVSHTSPIGTNDCYEFPDQISCKAYFMQQHGLQANPWV